MRAFGRDEKIRFRFRVNFHGGIAFIFRRDLLHQLIALPPDRRVVTSKPSPNARVIALPRVGGLQHRYEWRQAA